MTKRILSVILALIMVLGVMPFSVFADEVTDAPAGDEEVVAPDYSSGLDDTASYMLKLPEEGDLTYYHNDSSNTHSLQVDTIDGERFVRYGQYVIQGEQINSSLRAAKITYGYTDNTTFGVPEEIDMSKQNYIAIRVRVDSRAEAFTYENARFRIFLNVQNPETNKNIQAGIYGWNKTIPTKWLDLNDGSVSSMLCDGGWWTKRGWGTIGDLNGYILYPIAANTSFQKEWLQSGFKTVQVFIDQAEQASEVKGTNWDDADLLIGDSFFVEDVDKFVKARRELHKLEAYKSEYNDGSYYGSRYRGYDSIFRGYQVGLAVSKDIYNPAVQSTATNGMGNLHYVLLPEGDVAAVISLNDGKTSTNVQVTPRQTYEHSRSTDSASNKEFYGVPGLPDEIDATKITHIAHRIVMKGGTETQVTKLEITAEAQKQYGFANKCDVTLIDRVTGEQTVVTTNAGIPITGEFDGWIVYPTSYLVSSDGAYSFASEGTQDTYGGFTYFLRYGDWTDRTLYAGSTYLIEDYAKFKNVHMTPALDYTCTNDTITVKDVEEDAVYSIDGGKTWGTTTVFTGLEKDVAYNLCAKYTYIEDAMVRSITAWTAPYSSHLKDTASYYVKMLDEEKRVTANGGYLGWPSSTICKQSSGAYGSGNGQGLFVVNLGDDYYLEFDYNDATTGEANVSISAPMFTYGAKIGTMYGIDTDMIDVTNIKYLALRVKLDAGAYEGQQSITGVLVNGLDFMSFKAAKFIEYSTRQEVTYATDPGYKGIVFDDKAFDGWIIVPINEAWTDKTIKYNDADGVEQSYTVTPVEMLTGSVEPINGETNASSGSWQWWFHNYGVEGKTDCKHCGGQKCDWTGRNFYLGDVMLVEDAETFEAVRFGCDLLGHETVATETVVAPTCTEQGYTVYACKHCDYTENKDFVDATGHTHVEDPAAEVAPSCEAAGYKVFVCACGDTYTKETEPKTGHSYIELAREDATCDAAGFVETGCENCDYYEYKDIEATGHIYANEGAVAETAPTCDAAGFTTYTCDVCGDTMVVEGEAALGHNYVAGEVVAPKPGVQGYTVYTCANGCGATENRDFTDYEEPEEPEVPTNKVSNVVVNATDVDFTVTWDAFAGATGYYVRVRDAANSKNVAGPFNIKDASATSYKITAAANKLDYNTDYIFQVMAYVGNTYQSWADADAVVSQLEIGDRVVGLKATIQGKGALVTFLPVEGAQGYYAAVYLEDGTRHASIPINDANATSVTVINNLTAGTKYTVKVTPKLNGSYAPFTNALSVAFTAPVVNPTTYTVADQTAQSVRFNWDAVRGVQEYFIRVKEKDTGAQVKVIHVTGGKTTATLERYTDGTPLSPETTYTFEFCAYIPGMAMSYSAPVDFTTIGFEEVDVTAALLDTGKVELNWTKTTNAYAYYLYRIDAAGKKTYFKYLDGATTTFTVKAPTTAGDYTYGVVTVERNTSGTAYVPMAVSNTVTIL